MNKTVWIINQYGSTPFVGMGGRHYYFARELAKQGYTVYLIASASHHLLRETPKFEEPYFLDLQEGFNFVWIKMPQYSEAHSKQRVLNWLLFSWHLQKLRKLISDKPDAILCSSPSLLAYIGARRLAKSFKSKLVFEVRDIWPLTLTELGGYSHKHPFIRFMQWIEDKAYRESDAVVSNLKNSVEHMVSRKMPRDKFTWIPNGFSLDEVNKRVPLNQHAASQLPEGKFVIGYTGTIGVANSLDTLLTAARYLKEYLAIAFVIVGAGKEKNRLQRITEKDGLTNVYFIDPIPKVEIQAMLGRFDVCYIGWRDESLYRFGIGANKIPEYLYSGKPVIHSYSGSGDPISEAKAGIQVPAENAEKLAAAILKIYQMSQNERNVMGENGYKVAVEKYEYGHLAKLLADKLFSQ